MEKETKIINRQESQKSKKRFVLKNLSKSQRDILLNGGAALGGLGLGSLLASSFSFVPKDYIDEISDDVVDINAEVINDYEPPMVVYTEAPFSELELDNMPFGEAFAKAREDIGPGGFFEWHGNIYNTYYKEEWDAMSPEEQDQFMLSVVENTHFDNIEVSSDIEKILNELDDDKNLVISEDGGDENPDDPSGIEIDTEEAPLDPDELENNPDVGALDDNPENFHEFDESFNPEVDNLSDTDENFFDEINDA